MLCRPMQLEPILKVSQPKLCKQESDAGRQILDTVSAPADTANPMLSVLAHGIHFGS